MEKTLVENPLISVILGNYNYCHFIAKAIDSVLGQTYTNFELIIVDDGSTDSSREVITGYDDSRIRVIFQENGGQAAAFNAGFLVARGEIIAFIDSDDWWRCDKLECILEWHRFLNADYGILQHQLDVWEDGNKRPYKLTLPVGDCFSEMQESGKIDFFVPTSGLCFRKEILNMVFPIPTVFRFSADAYLMRTAFVFGKVYSIPEALGVYRRHGDAVSGDKVFYENFIVGVLIPELNKFYKAQNTGYQLSLQNTKIPELDAIYSSTSWRVTKPIRFISDIIKKLKGK
jgi:glycosyltransferase involved in cell wall biosynthesis